MYIIYIVKYIKATWNVKTSKIINIRPVTICQTNFPEKIEDGVQRNIYTQILIVRKHDNNNYGPKQMYKIVYYSRTTIIIMVLNKCTK